MDKMVEVRFRDIQKIIEYLFEDEQRHYEEEGGNKDNHIFSSIENLKVAITNCEVSRCIQKK